MTEVLTGEWPGETAPVAVVTGAGQGIGRAIALALAGRGLRVAVNDLKPATAEEVATEIRDAGGDATAMAGDVTDVAAVEHMAAEARSWAGRVDVLVNNAGISDVVIPTEQQDVDRWQSTVDVLFRGPYLCSKVFGAEFMLPARFGRIVNIASIASITPLPMRNAYGPSKAAVVMLTRNMAAEWARYGITVNAVAPGYIETDMVRNLVHAGKLDTTALRRRIPAGALGTPDDIARAVTFLAAPASSYITGALLAVDGGWTSFGAAGDAFPVETTDPG